MKEHQLLLETVNELTARLQSIRSGDWVNLMCSSGRWVATAYFTNTLRFESDDPFKALAAMDQDISRREAAGDALAQTLGIEAA